MIKFTAIVSMLDSSVYGYHLPVPSEVMEPFKDTDRRVIARFNGHIETHCALMPKGEGEYMILLHKELRKKLGIELGDTVDVKIQKDTSKYGMPIPEEMKEMLAIDPEADQHFHQLTPGKQRSLLYMIGKPKSSDIRIKKALSVCEYLKTSRGKLDFKALNEFMKNFSY